MTTHSCRRFGLIVPPETAGTSSQPAAGSGTANSGDRPIIERFMTRLKELVRDAEENDSTEVLVNCLSLTLATIVVQSGNLSATGDVLRKLGNQIININEWIRARAKAKTKLDNGATTH